jgi:hypothetical protein
MQPDDDNRLPQALLDELRSEDRQTRILTARVDRKIEAMAEEQFAGRKRPLWQSRPAWAAVAASAFVAFFLIQSQSPMLVPVDTGLADVDGSGRVDIVDVLAMARDTSAMSQSDIDAFAYRVVSLNSVEDER